MNICRASRKLRSKHIYQHYKNILLTTTLLLSISLHTWLFNRRIYGKEMKHKQEKEVG